MPETLFHFDGSNYQTCQRAFRGDRDQEYYLGDLTIDAGDLIDVCAVRAVFKSISVIHLRSRTRHSFRRRQAHIREDALDLSVLWFVRRGELRLASQLGSSVAGPGDFVLTRSTTTFAMECLTDSASAHETLHVVIPTHALRSYLSVEIPSGFVLSRRSRHVRIAENIFASLLDDQDVAPDTTQLLVDAALLTLAHVLRDAAPERSPRVSLADQRYQQMISFIDRNLTDPDLNIEAVARACRISTRYVSFILQRRRELFSDILWSRRLGEAKSRLSSMDHLSETITDIGYATGFKSPAHFSRMFKKVFGVSPRDYRKTGLPQSVGPRGRAAKLASAAPLHRTSGL